MRHFQAAGADGSSVAQPQRAGSGVGTRPPSPSFHDRNASARLPTLAACEPSEKEGEFLWPINAATIDTARSEEHTSELQSLMRISYAVFCLKKKNRCNISTIQHKSMCRLNMKN